jgi:hypothetical protein
MGTEIIVKTVLQQWEQGLLLEHTVATLGTEVIAGSQQ